MSDSLALVQACRGTKDIGHIRHIVHDIKALRASFEASGFSWTPREGNSVAHLVAKLSKECRLHHSWVWNPPPEIHGALARDRALSSSDLRLIIPPLLPLEQQLNVAPPFHLGLNTRPPPRPGEPKSNALGF